MITGRNRKPKALRAFTLGEEAIATRDATDIDLPDRPREREEMIDRLARTPLPTTRRD